MEEKKPDFSFGPAASQDEREPTVRELRLLEETARRPAPLGGYDPYDRETGRDAARTAVHKTSTTTRTDLRKLSEWIKLKKEVESLKADPAPAKAATPVAPQAEEPEPVPTVRLPRPTF